MTLTQKTICTIVSLVAGLLLLSGAMLWGLWGLRRDVHVTFDEYSELQLVHSTDLAVASAEALLASEPPDSEAIIVRLQDAIRQLEAFLDLQGNEVHREARSLHEELEVRRASLARERLLAVIAYIQEAREQETAPMDTGRIVGLLTEVLASLDHLGRLLDAADVSAREAANSKFRVTLTIAATLCVAIVLVTVFISVSQYRSVVRPLGLLREGVRRVSAGKFTERIAEVGDGEFAELTEEFNRMAAELNELYRTLESKVAAKSKELVRSERLASVGFLGAGVAHEISSPLNIISGYAELTLKRVRVGGDAAGGVDIPQALQIIRDESFRCKEIIEQLLSFTRLGEQPRQRVSLSHIADDVVSMMSSLGPYPGRRTVLALDGSEDLTVLGNETELKQVLLNLTVNALEAVQPGPGEVVIDGRRRDGWVELGVTDNGRGMTIATLEHLFEPFFTDRREGSARGSGLGLSIAHAIVEAHGGRIVAESDGPGRGSRLVVQLPALAEDEGHEWRTSKAARANARPGR